MRRGGPRTLPPSRRRKGRFRSVSVRALVCCIAAAVAVVVAVAPASADVRPYRENDFGGFQDVLPPGTDGSANLVELAAFLATGARPPHNADQLGMYARLLSSVPGVTAK